MIHPFRYIKQTKKKKEKNQKKKKKKKIFSQFILNLGANGRRPKKNGRQPKKKF